VVVPATSYIVAVKNNTKMFSASLSSSTSSFNMGVVLMAMMMVVGYNVVVISGQDYDGIDGLPGGSEDILSAPYDESFSCEGRDYGYYADIANNCEIFHVCMPIQDNDGNVIEFAKWSFICGNGTVFDQEILACNHPENAFPCEESEAMYNIVEFGVIPDEA